MLSADRRIDYSARLGEITTPTLMIAGDGDIMSDVPSTELTLTAVGSPDKTLWRFGRANGNVADYGHCDLVLEPACAPGDFPTLDRLARPAPARLRPDARGPCIATDRSSLSQSAAMIRCRFATRFRIPAGWSRSWEWRGIRLRRVPLLGARPRAVPARRDERLRGAPGRRP